MLTLLISIFKSQNRIFAEICVPTPLIFKIKLMKTTFADFDLQEKILDVLADLELFEPTPIQEKKF